MTEPVSPQGQGVAEELRSLADCDARAGAPLGKCMREAAALLERYHAALEQLVAACEQRRVQDFDPASPITVIETRTADIIDFHDALDIAHTALTGEATESPPTDAPAK